MSRNSDNTNFDESTAMLLMEKIKEKDTKKIKDYIRVSSKPTKFIYMWAYYPLAIILTW